MDKIFKAAKKRYGLRMNLSLISTGVLAILLVFGCLLATTDSVRWEDRILPPSIIGGLYAILFVWIIYYMKTKKYCSFLLKYIENLTRIQAQQFIKDFEHGTKHKNIIFGEEYIFFFDIYKKLYGCSYKDIQQAGWHAPSDTGSFNNSIIGIIAGLIVKHIIKVRPALYYYIYILGEKKMKIIEMEQMNDIAAVEERANLCNSKISSKNPHVDIKRLDEIPAGSRF